MNTDSQALWTRLYEVCKAIRKLNPWEFRVEEDIVVIEDPKTNMRIYCMIQDNREEEELTIQILQGQASMRAYIESLTYEDGDLTDHDYIKSLYRQQGFIVCYVNRQDLFEEDYDRIKFAGMGFRGKMQWPILRRVFPGSKPWLLEQDEDVESLTRYLEQLLSVWADIDRQKIDEREGYYLTLYFEDETWKLGYILEEELLDEEDPFVYRDELKIHRIKKLPKQPMMLEGSQFYLPTPLWDEEKNRELFPLLTTFVDHQTGEVYSGEMCKSEPYELEEISNQLATVLLDRLKARPSKIIVSDDVLLELIYDFCQKVDISCEIGATVAAAAFMNSFLSEQMNALGSDEILPLIQAAEQIYEVMLETSLGQRLNLIQKSAMKDVWIYSVLFLYQEFNELPGTWTKEGFEALLQSRLLEESIREDYREYIPSSIKAYLDCQQELGVFKNSFALSHILTKYYG
ncbi:MAG: hypothetical protein K2G70_00770 [Turicibacter sp.]|nr:hypothetical protein [Turicibacter sp.]